MQLFNTYGFYVLENGIIESDRYLEIKSFIEEICKNAEKIANKYNKTFICHYLPINKNLSITCCVFEKKASFGLYDHKNKCIYLETNMKSLNTFTELHKNQLIVRIEGAAKHSLNLSPIDKIWLEIKTLENYKDIKEYDY